MELEDEDNDIELDRLEELGGDDADKMELDMLLELEDEDNDIELDRLEELGGDDADKMELDNNDELDMLWELSEEDE